MATQPTSWIAHTRSASSFTALQDHTHSCLFEAPWLTKLPEVTSAASAATALHTGLNRKVADESSFNESALALEDLVNEDGNAHHERLIHARWHRARPDVALAQVEVVGDSGYLLVVHGAHHGVGLGIQDAGNVEHGVRSRSTLEHLHPAADGIALGEIIFGLEVEQYLHGQ